MRKPDPKFRAFYDELNECRRVGMAYVASDPVSFIVLDADDMRREGKIREAQKLENAGRAVARAHVVAITAVRRAAVKMKPRKIANERAK